MKVLNKLGYLLIRGHFPDRFEYQHTDSRTTGIEAMAPERIDQFSHRRYVSLSLLSFHLSCIMVAQRLCIMTVQLMGAVPVLPVARWLLSTIAEHQSWIELWYWSVGFMICFPGVNLVLLYFGLVPPSAPLIPPIVFWLIYHTFITFIRRSSSYRN